MIALTSIPIRFRIIGLAMLVLVLGVFVYFLFIYTPSICSSSQGWISTPCTGITVTDFSSIVSRKGYMGHHLFVANTQVGSIMYFQPFSEPIDGGNEYINAEGNAIAHCSFMKSDPQICKWLQQLSFHEQTESMTETNVNISITYQLKCQHEHQRQYGRMEDVHNNGRWSYVFFSVPTNAYYKY